MGRFRSSSINVEYDIRGPLLLFYLFIQFIFAWSQSHMLLTLNEHITIASPPDTQMVTNENVPPKQIKDESKRTDGG